MSGRKGKQPMDLMIRDFRNDLFMFTGSCWQFVSTKVVGNVAVITLDDRNAEANYTTPAMRDEVREAFCQVSRDASVRAVIFMSGKPDCFIAGADLAILDACQTAADLEQLGRDGHEFLNEVANLEMPVVTALSGTCLGGGVEMALACHYRVALDNRHTLLSLPEVLVGFVPGGGGTQRILQVSSLPNALDVLLSGRAIRARNAKKMGLVDLLVSPLNSSLDPADLRSFQYLEEVAIKTASALASGSFKIDRKNKNIKDRALDFILSFNFIKDIIFNGIKAQILKMTGGHNPAPFKILEVVRTNLDKGEKAGFEAEIKAFGGLGMTPQAKGLLALVSGQIQCKKNRYGKPEKEVKTIAVLGAGSVGAGIAQVSVDCGLRTILKDTSQTELSRGYNQISDGLDAAVRRKEISWSEYDEILSKLELSPCYDKFKNCDMVIEAVTDDLSLKQKVISEVEASAPPHCIIASHSSAIETTKLAATCKRPEKLVGMHYFSPVDKMQLVEVITTDKTSQDTTASAVAVALKQGKAVIIVKDTPGYYTNRILCTITSEVLRLLQEGIEPETLDDLTKKFGFPVGIVTIVDEVGIDVASHVIDYLVSVYGQRMAGGDSNVLKEMKKSNFLGKRSNEGFYFYYEDGKISGVNDGALAILRKFRLEPKGLHSDEDIQLRIVCRFVNEAIFCLQERVLNGPVEGDVGAIFGLAFPPFTGGPFHWVDSFGAENLVAKMRTFEAQYGPAFTPCQLLLDVAYQNKKFYPR